MAFLQWMCENYRIKKERSLKSYWRMFKMLHRRHNGCAMNTNDGTEVINVSHFILSISFLHE
jgi:hypothetical protein